MVVLTREHGRHVQRTYVARVMVPVHEQSLMIRIKDVTAMMTQCLIDISHASKATPRLSRARKYRLSRADVVFKLKAVATCNVEHNLDYSGLPAKLSQMMLLEMSDDKSMQCDIIDVQIGELALTACACDCEMRIQSPALL